MAKKIKLVAQVSHRKGKTAKVPVVTDVTIRIDGERGLAFKTLGGKYTAEQALSEFRKGYKTFTPQPGFTPETVATYALAA